MGTSTVLSAPWTGQSTPKILIVDDQRRNLFVMEKVLEELPATLLFASSGDEALAHALRHDLALAILDVQMPGMDGFELAELLHGNPPTARLPIIFLSAAFADEAHRFRGYEMGAVDYLVKPVDPKVLVGKARVFLELAQTRAELESLVQQRTRALEAKAGKLARGSRCKALLSTISRDLVRRDPAEVRQAVASAIGRVASFIGARSGEVLFGPATDGAQLEVAANLVWRDHGDPAFGGCQRTFAPLLSTLGEEGHLYSSLAEFPAALGEVREALARKNVGALLVLPILEERVAIGAVLFAWSPPASRLWAPPEADLPSVLGLLPELLFGALLRARAEARRAASEARYRLLFETMDQGVIFHDAAGVISDANPAACRILGKGELRGATTRDSAWTMVNEHSRPLAFEEQPAQRCLASGHPVEGVMGVLNQADHAHRWLEVRAVPISNDLVCVTFSDVSDLRRATGEKERLMHIEAESRAKSRFLASMSHEVRTPMNAILGYTQLLLRERDLTSRQRDYLETIDRSGEHLVALVNNVLDMARIESGKDTLDLTRVDFAELLIDLERMFRLRASEKRLKLTVDRGATPRHLLLDAGKVRQVLINLLSNALKFTEAGEIAMRAQATMVSELRARVVLEVQDSGIGIPTDRLADIFEPFVQVSRSAIALGTGLGLTVCRRFARLMGGDVAVLSRLGAGSTFRFEFEADLAAPAEAEPAIERVVGMASAPVRVLVVEDDGDNRAMMTTLLRSVGLAVSEAVSAEAAMASFSTSPVDLVLTDMRLPGSDGLELMRKLRELPGGRTVPVVVVSASTMTDERARALAAGVDGFVSKPVRESGVFKLISQLTTARFTFADDEGTPQPQPLTSAALAQLPPERRAALVTALKSGYAEQLGREIDALPASCAGLVSELRRLAEGFEYRRFLELLEGAP